MSLRPTPPPLFISVEHRAQMMLGFACGQWSQRAHSHSAVIVCQTLQALRAGSASCARVATCAPYGRERSVVRRRDSLSYSHPLILP